VVSSGLRGGRGISAAGMICMARIVKRRDRYSCLGEQEGSYASVFRSLNTSISVACFQYTLAEIHMPIIYEYEKSFVESVGPAFCKACSARRSQASPNDVRRCLLGHLNIPSRLLFICLRDSDSRFTYARLNLFLQ